MSGRRSRAFESTTQNKKSIRGQAHPNQINNSRLCKITIKKQIILINNTMTRKFQILTPGSETGSYFSQDLILMNSEAQSENVINDKYNLKKDDLVLSLNCIKRLIYGMDTRSVGRNRCLRLLVC